MNLAQFIQQGATLVRERPVFFIAEQYPLLFISRLLARVARETGLPKTAVDLDELALTDLKAQLSMSFLGQQRMFWLGDCSTMQAKQWAAVQTFLKNYSGPHAVLAFHNKEVADAVVLPPALDSKTCDILTAVFADDERERALSFVRYVLRQVTALSLDQAVRVAEYGLLAGAGREAFMREWLPRIVPAQASLYDLSAALLARDVQRFLTQWHAARGFYPTQFWVAYFSEQLFRAHSYVQMKRLGLEARTVGFRLPFAFVQRDWRQADLAFLCAAHERIAHLDRELKNGSDELLMDSALLSLFS